jgi:hypothetical protein
MLIVILKAMISLSYLMVISIFLFDDEIQFLKRFPFSFLDESNDRLFVIHRENINFTAKLFRS